MKSVFRAWPSEVKASRAIGLLRTGGRAVLDTIYPPHCLGCEEAVTTPGTLCGSCWSQTPFIDGLACDSCGAPQVGHPDDAPVQCDDCLTTARPWSHGRAAMIYSDVSRRMVLGLKYADRHDVATPAGQWMARCVAPLIRQDTVIAPVPLHRWRLFTRRYNQSALLAAALAKAVARPHCPDLLLRTKRTTTQEGRTRAGRFDNLQSAISAHPRRAHLIEGRHIVLVDDVMTSGATLAAATEACFAGGADDVDVVVVARVLRDE